MLESGINHMLFPCKVKWIATAVTLVGAMATALQYDPLNIYLLNAGAILFLWWAILIKDKAMITVNAGLLATYILGIFIRL
jgi:hypothetical protein